MIGHIYKVTNSINGKIYIGQTIQSVKDRWYRHCGKSSLSKEEMGMHIKRAILKYGKENFTVETIEDCDSSLLDEKERYYISYYNSYKNGYNETLGGQSGGRPLQVSDEDQNTIVSMYKEGASLRGIARKFNIDHAAVKKVVERHGLKLRKTRTYKFSSEQRQAIVDAVKCGTPRKEIMNKYGISKGYLSSLLSGYRRI